ncbi:hypothetical protein XENTR_v10022107 [Xenopus tropicalis]|uniref:WAP four-disulfide core domain protein 2-like n=1 Tax=Xenopus tropicalis TaxID=8364 RepID=A0A8J1IP06_XENTR|nr:WAP four-disulfide core domain protein 2-like [Xenopus tropicalis]KAE8587779.1 hypothetical protein XENTR_v10022107 [Xenopus tropicalis]
MRVHPLYAFLLLTVIVIWLDCTAAKSGCPSIPANAHCRGHHDSNKCRKDNDCKSWQRCCYNGCYWDCADVPHDGCPSIPANARCWGHHDSNKCRKDNDCKSWQKCCYNGCYWDCENVPHGGPPPHHPPPDHHPGH